MVAVEEADTAAAVGAVGALVASVALAADNNHSAGAVVVDRTGKMVARRNTTAYHIVLDNRTYY